jgi:methylenetetrahydrofolate reductase (NADPH)
MLSFIRNRKMDGAPTGAGLHGILQGFSIEVMPRTAAKVGNFKTLLLTATRIYIAHIDGTPIDEMVATATRLSDAGFAVMPHIPARIIKDRATLQDWLTRYRDEAGVTQALLLAGRVSTPPGDFHSSMQLLETGLFDQMGFTHLHAAGHPEGNRDIDPDGGSRVLNGALVWKQDFSSRTDAKMAIATQFVFEAQPVLDWIVTLREICVTLPVHVGTAVPAKLQTLIKFAPTCGVGPSLRVLRRRARDLTTLLKPYEPSEILTDFAKARAFGTENGIAKVHFFRLGGIKINAGWAQKLGAVDPSPIT